MKIKSRNQNFEAAIDEAETRERFQGEVRKHLGNDTEISDLFVTRVFPRKEGGLTIQYELHLKRPDRDKKEKLILCGHLLGDGQEFPAYIADSRERCIVIDDIGLVVPLFPFDPALPSLEILTEINDQTSIFQKLASVLGGKVKISNIEILGYRLEKRCVIRYDVKINGESLDNRKIVAKAYRRSRFAKSLESISALEDKGFGNDAPDGLTVPRILGNDNELSAIFMEDAPGISLHNLMDKGIFPYACTAAGGMLRKLHRVSANGLKTHTKLDELGNLRKMLELIYYMYPEFEDTFNSELNSLTNDAGGDFLNFVYSHRDFFDKQVLFSESRTTLLDYADPVVADPALDAGNFVAHMDLRKLQHPDCSENIRSGSEAFIASYGNSEESFLVRTAWWIRASRLRLAALYMLRPRWRYLAYKLLTQPIDLLGQRVPGGINEK